MAALSSTSYLHSLVGNERHFFSCKTSQFSKPLSISPSLNKPRFSVPFCTKQSDRDQKLTKQESKKNEEKEDYWVVIAVRSKYRCPLDYKISISFKRAKTHRFTGGDILGDFGDFEHDVDEEKTHSAINKGGENWTDSYWDEFASLPPIVPDGPIAIYGLGGGTAARLILELYPSTQLEGWEIDDILIEKAREYMELSELEKLTSKGGSLRVLIDDALSLSEDVSGKYAGIIVDLFADGKDLDQLQQILQMVMFEYGLLYGPFGKDLGFSLPLPIKRCSLPFCLTQKLKRSSAENSRRPETLAVELSPLLSCAASLSSLSLSSPAPCSGGGDQISISSPLPLVSRSRSRLRWSVLNPSCSHVLYTSLCWS
uniref:PABS domain-containing protein n=1 Tax=Brassica oleracea var. oleracea TaxID=109376 RepID=A0A0D3DPG7_BRAOL